MNFSGKKSYYYQHHLHPKSVNYDFHINYDWINHFALLVYKQTNCVFINTKINISLKFEINILIFFYL